MFIIILSVYFDSLMHGLMYVSDSIFTGIKIVSPVLALVCWGPMRSRLMKIGLIINNLLLVGGIFFLVAMTANIFNILQNGNEDEKSFILSAITGAHWYQFVIPVFIFGIIPNLIWFKQIRKNIYSSMVIVTIWLIDFVILMSPGAQFKGRKVFAYGFFGFSFTEFIQKFGVFLVFYFLLYFIFEKGVVKERQ